MNYRNPLALVVSLGIVGCTTLYSSPETWQGHQFNAVAREGITGRRLVIYCDGKPLMEGKAKHWAKRLTMTATLDGQQAAAECGGEEGARVCAITVSGTRIATLKF